MFFFGENYFLQTCNLLDQLRIYSTNVNDYNNNTNSIRPVIKLLTENSNILNKKYKH